MRGKNGRSVDEELRQEFFDLLACQYRTMPNRVKNIAAEKEAEQIIATPIENITWDKIYRLELAILKVAPVCYLQREVWDLQQQFFTLASPDERENYKSALAALSAGGSRCNDWDESLRANAEQLRGKLSWQYMVRWSLERFRREMGRMLCWISLSSIVALLLLAYGFDSVWLLAAGVGLSGGFISTLERIQSVKLDGNSDLSLIEFKRGLGSGIIASPFEGALFAVVLCCLFMGEFIQGEIFPRLSDSESVRGFLDSSRINADLAKLAVWSFLAGFSERLVPDRLKQIAGQANKAEAQKQSALNGTATVILPPKPAKKDNALLEPAREPNPRL